MAEQKRIVISNPQRGISSSPLDGFCNIRCADIYTEPGIARPSFATIKRSGTVIPSAPISMVRFNSKYYVLDENKYLYVSANGITNWAAVTGGSNFSDNDIIVWNGYLIGAYGTSIKAMSTSEAFTTLASSVSNYSRRLVLGDDNKVYIIGRKISLLEEAIGATFAPGTTSTYSVTNDVIKLHAGASPKCATAWNGQVVIGTDDGYIYRWDGVGPLFLDKTKTPENSVDRLININRVLYAQCGNFFNLYSYDGSRVYLLKRIPEYITGFYSTGLSNDYANGIAEIDGRIFFGVRGDNAGASGVYSYDLNTGNIVMEVESAVGSDSDVIVSLISPTSEREYFIGYVYGGSPASYGIESTGTARYTGDKTVLDYELLNVSNGYAKTTIRQPEINFAYPLSTDDSAKIYYRQNLSASWTLHATVSTAGTMKHVMNDIPDVNFIQIRIVLNNNARFSSLIL